MNSKTTLAVSLLMIASGFFLVASDVSEVFAEEECRTLYTYSPAFKSTAQYGEFVCWDFGDGVVLD